MAAPRQTLDLYHEWDDDEDRAVKGIFHYAITHHDTSRIEEAAISLDKLAAQAGPPRGFVSALMPDMFIYMATITPFDSPHQDNLILLLSTLLHLPERTDIKCHPEWADLFGQDAHIQIVEAWHGGYALQNECRSEDAKLAAIAQARWRNFNAFNARLYKSGLYVCGRSAHDSMYYPLEYPLHDDDRIPLKLHVNIMLDWFDILGDVLLDEEPLKEYDRTHNNPGNIYKGEHRGFSPHRWEFWASRMEEYSHEETWFDEQTRARLVDAAKKIREKNASRGVETTGLSAAII